MEGILSVFPTDTLPDRRLVAYSSEILLSMTPNNANPLSAFGFLTVLEDRQHGFFGGYLVLSDLGRPLEFHCSTPVLPNEAQKILYGASLRPYVLGELIGQTLVAKGKLAVRAVVTDLEEMLSLALFREETLVCLAPHKSALQAENAESENAETENAESENGQPTSSDPPVPELTIGNYRLFGSSTCTWQPEQLRDSLAELCSHVDLSEPFQRIREAICEAQRITEHEADDHEEPSVAA